MYPKITFGVFLSFTAGAGLNSFLLLFRISYKLVITTTPSFDFLRSSIFISSFLVDIFNESGSFVVKISSYFGCPIDCYKKYF